MEELSVPDPLVEPGPEAHTEAAETKLDEEADNVEDLSRSSSPDSMVLAIDEAINILDPPRARVSLLKSWQSYHIFHHSKYISQISQRASHRLATPPPLSSRIQFSSRVLLPPLLRLIFPLCHFLR